MKEDEQAEWNIADLVVVAKFGEPIYPYLKQMDSVCNAPDSNLWHTLIEADNYHALLVGGVVSRSKNANDYFGNKSKRQ